MQHVCLAADPFNQPLLRRGLAYGLDEVAQPRKVNDDKAVFLAGESGGHVPHGRASREGRTAAQAAAAHPGRSRSAAPRIVRLEPIAPELQRAIWCVEQRGHRVGVVAFRGNYDPSKEWRDDFCVNPGRDIVDQDASGAVLGIWIGFVVPPECDPIEDHDR
ncbi:hypothetical protein ON010_g4891 [Phytophthora cinnamomi]|nr:hypothetical protein ON010_g4891 [Phytophthora cinnamomi]